MQGLTRFWFFVNGLLALVVACRSAIDESVLAVWRKTDAIWGPDAVPFKMAAWVAVGISYLYAMLSPSTFARDVRWRIGAFIGLNVLVGVSSGKSIVGTTLLLVVCFVSACIETDGERQSKSATLASRS